MTERFTVLVHSSIKEEAISSGGLQAPGTKPSDIELDTKRITDEVSKLLRCIEGVEVPRNGHFEVSEVQFNLGFNASGKLGFLSSGVEAGVEAAIVVTIRRCTQTT
jgi:hypothetical protein